MGLSCTCKEWYGDPGTWAFFQPKDFTVLTTKRRKRCCSCKALIDVGSDCLRFDRLRAPYNEIEEKILGDEILIPPHYMCYHCGEIYLNLEAIGYCVNPYESMDELLSEYHEMTGFKATINKGGL
jgi:hypothetical protein